MEPEGSRRQDHQNIGVLEVHEVYPTGIIPSIVWVEFTPPESHWNLEKIHFSLNMPKAL